MNTNTMTDYAAVQMFGTKTCKSLVMNALREAVDRHKESERWVHIGELCHQRVKEWKQDKIRHFALGLWCQAEIRNQQTKKEVERLLKVYRWCKPSYSKRTTIDKEFVRESVHMRDVVERYHPVNRQNKSICPAHNDARPSMHVYPDGVHCFVCGFHADQFGYVQEIEKVDFVTALQKVGSV